MLPLLLLLGLVGSGCAGKAQRPSAAVRGVHLGEVSDQGMVLNFALDLQNPTPASLPIGEMSYQLSVNGVEVLRAVADPPGTLAARQSATISFPVMLTFQNLLAAEDSLDKEQPAVELELIGELSLSDGARLFNRGLQVPIRHIEMFDLRSILNNPRLVLRSPAARRLAERVVGVVWE